MSKKQIIGSALLSSILTFVFALLIWLFPMQFFRCAFIIVSIFVLFLILFVLIAIVWTKGNILPSPHPCFYIDCERKREKID